MKTKKLIKHLFAEYEDFTQYMDLYDECVDSPATKAELRKVAEEEMHHYKNIYDVLFPQGLVVAWTPIEAGVYEYATHLYEKMNERFANSK